MEVIFDVAKNLFHDMCIENMTFSSQDVKWKDHLLGAGLKMDEERCQTKRKGKIISPNKHFKIVRHNHVQTLDNKKKSPLSILHFVFSKKPGTLGPFI